jgi:hypothetical protein
MPIVYIVDSSSLIELKVTYPADTFPGVWNKMEWLIREGRLIAPKEVLEEIRRRDDELSQWAKNYPKMFKEIDEQQIEMVRDIVGRFPLIAHIEKEGPNADPWLIALAKALETQPALWPQQYVIVTEESTSRRDRIPYVCSQYGVESINILQLFQKEGWEFR